MKTVKYNFFFSIQPKKVKTAETGDYNSSAGVREADAFLGLQFWETFEGLELDERQLFRVLSVRANHLETPVLTLLSACIRRDK